MKKLLIIIALFISTITINVYAKEGWVEENGEKYYYENDKPISGFKEIDGENYFFGITTHKLLHGWQYWNGKFYLDKDGKVNQGWNTIDGEKYYVRDNYLVNKFQEIDGETYFFGLTTYKLLHGWQYWNGKFYLDGEGKVKQGWNNINGEKYYVRDNYLVNKFQEIDGETYFFGLTTYKLLYGWQGYNGKFYAKEDGIIPKGWFNIGVDKYYSKDSHIVTGINNIDGINYYFTQKGVLVEKSQKTKYKEILVDEETKEFIKVQYIPTYYNQKDSKWTNKKYGIKKFGPTGCAPTSMAMAFTSIKEKTILPTDVGDYLYNHTDQFNKKSAGTSGKAIIYATKNYGVNQTPIKTKDNLIKELSSGKIVFAAMGNGKFGTAKWNHAIVVYNYNEENNKTYAMDPLNKDNNGWISVNTIWNEQSNDSDDISGGAALYALSE